MKTTALVTTLLIGCLAATAQATTPATTENVRQQVVSFADLNLETEAGAKTLLRRIKFAARRVCGVNDAGLMRDRVPCPAAPLRRAGDCPRRCGRRRSHDRRRGRPLTSRPTPLEENDYVQVQARRCRAVGHGHVWSAGFLSARTGRRRHRLECDHDGCSHDRAPRSAGHARRGAGPHRHARRHSVDREEVRAVSLPAQGCEGLAHGCGGCRCARRARQHLSDPGHHARCEVLRLSRRSTV